MSDYLISIYNFFKSRLLIFALLVLAVTGLSLFYASKLKLKENITDMMPNDPRVKKINEIFQNSRFSDKLIVNVYLKDSLQTNPDLLVAFSDSVAEVLKNQLQPSHIADIRVKVSDEVIGDVFNSVTDNLPIYLSEKDYSGIDSLLTQSSIDSQLYRNYKTLISPASIVLKSFVLKDPLGIGGNVLKKLQSLQYDENYDLYDGHVVTKDHKNLLFFISPVNPPAETGKNVALINGLDKAIETTVEKFDSKIVAEYFGAAAVSVGNAERIKSDITVTVSLAVTLLIVFMSLFFRKVYVIFIIFLPVAIGGLVSVGTLYFIKGEISAIALGMGSVLLGITVDYSLHIFTHYRATGSVTQIYKDLTIPLILSCLITASSFLCLLFVKSDALKDLGLFAAISVVNALIAALLILPHFLTRGKKHDPSEKQSGMVFLEKIISYRFDKSIILIAVIIIITIVSIFTSRKVQFETDMMKLNYVSEKLYNAEKNLYKISNHALKSIYIVASGKTVDDALEANEEINATIQNLKKEGVVKAASGVGDFMISEALQKERIKQWEDFWNAQRKQKVKELLYQSGKKYKFNETAFKPFLNSLDKKFTTISQKDNENFKTLLFNDFITDKPGFSTVVTLLKVDEDRKERVYSAFPHDAENITVIDRKQITSRFVELMRDDFNTLEVLSLGLVFIVLLFWYGRIELAIIGFLPMILSWLWTIGIMGMFEIKFNILNIIISTFILGLGIDYSIFIMSGLIDEYKRGIQHLASFKTSIFLSAFTSISGIGALIFADHPALQSIAALSIIGMCSVITISYTIQPFLFRKLISDRTKKGLEPFTLKSLFVTFFAYTYFLFGCFLLSILVLIILPVLPLKENSKKKFFHYLLSKFCKSQLYIMLNVKKKVVNTTGEDFSKPSVIILNHQSFLDILMTVMLSPKIILITNDWVWNSPFFGKIVKYADFFPASKGLEEGIDDLEEIVKKGYSIAVFPEGTRSQDGKIGRFHKGAFFLSEKLQLDIIPIVLHGTGDTIKKNDLLLGDGPIIAKILPRIKSDDTSFGETYQDRTKSISKYFKQEYDILKVQSETPEYFRDRLIKNYLYKGPVLEWYMRIKSRMENNYSYFDSLLPREGNIVDIGCGYGFLSYSLNFLSSRRNILALDYDEEKIEVASHCFSKNDKIDFQVADVTNYDLPASDAFILSDVLHYFPVELQDRLINQCIDKLNNNGILIIRDGNKDLIERHKGTKLTEFFSIKVLRFNKTEYSLSYVSGSRLKNLCEQKNLDLEIVDKTKLTSNTFYLIRKNKSTILV